MSQSPKLRYSYRPPKAVTSNVKRGEGLAKKWSRGGSSTSAASAGDASHGLASGGALSWDDIQKMSNYFECHPNSFNPNKLEQDGGPNEDTINWLLNGGTAGKQWSKRMVNQNLEDTMKKKFEYKSNVLKVDESLGLVFGFAITCKQDGEDIYDLQNDHIPEDAMLKASLDFMQGQRTVGDMHESEEGGQVVFAFPMTTEIAKSLGIVTKTTGLLIAIKPGSQKTLEKFKDGTYNGFSIGGERITDEEVDNE